MFALFLSRRVEELNLDESLARATYQGQSLWVDTQHLLGIELRLGSLFQFLGEMECNEGETPVVRISISIQVHDKYIHFV